MTSPCCQLPGPSLREEYIGAWQLVPEVLAFFFHKIKLQSRFCRDPFGLGTEQGALSISPLWHVR